MQKYHYLLSFLALSLAVTIIVQMNQSKQPSIRKASKQERIEGAIEYSKLTSSDVDLGYIPYDKLFSAINEGKKRLASPTRRSAMPGSITNPIWRERGPDNRGGRTRAIMIDEADPSRNTIWAGGVSGGIWKTEDITKADPQWQKLGIYFESLAISDFAQDPNDLDVVYVSTGESYTGDVRGAGIFRTEDAGETFTLLPSTDNLTFQTVNEIHAHTNGDLYAATAIAGIMRSKDRGETWENVLATGLSGANNNDFHDFIYTEVNNTFYASNDNSIFKSTTGNRGDWVNIGTGKPGFPTNLQRTEMAVCPNDPDLLYCIGSLGEFSSSTFVSIDGGLNWTTRSEPAIFSGYGQAWYDLDLQADPFSCSKLLSGGVNMAESNSQGLSWLAIAPNMHADHHTIYFDPKKQGRVLFGNDGGIWLSENGGANYTDKSFGYVTTQFYAAAIHPAPNSPYVMGGTQDNNSLIIDDAGLSPSRVAWGGDGMFCFIDQNEPNIQIVSSQFGNYGLSTNGGVSFGLGATVNGAFVNQSGYDDIGNKLYGQVNDNNFDFFRWNVDDFEVVNVNITNYNLDVTAIKVDPNRPNRVYFGDENGIVVKVDNAHDGNSLTATTFADLPVNTRVSCIYMDKSSNQEALVSFFSYGEGLENIWITYDDGGQWQSIEGDLPDVPVRWALFDPANHDRAMIATDAGVWTTDDINGNSTHWEPTNPDNGMPFVRVDMLLLRDSDKVVLGATYGRGLMTTDVFSAPAALIKAQPIAYEGQDVIIDGTHSVNAQSYEWDLGDNTTSTDPIVSHQYENLGTYTIVLKINGEISTTKTIAVLPYLPAPYQPGDVNYAGDFETQPSHFAPYTVQGTGFQRGNSTKPGKNGTNSGTNAWVLGINDNLYQNNTRSELYTPLYDLTVPGLYEFKFFAKYAVQSKNDGFQVEYSTDAGFTWKQLGNETFPNWYNYHNSNITNGAFPQGYSYFTNAQLEYKQFIKDISFLVGEPQVSFRFVFRSDKDEPAQGLAIDDVEITKYEGELKTTVTVFNAEYVDEQEVEVNWTTGIEYQCKEFILERSYTGVGFEQVAQTPAKGIVTTFATEYSRTTPNLQDVVYYRLKVINENVALGYYYEFYTDTIVLRRDVEPNIVHEVFPSPFYDRIGITFSSVVNEQIVIRMYDASGKFIKEDIAVPNSVYYDISQLDFPAGIYFMSVQIGEGELKTFKLLTLGN